MKDILNKYGKWILGVCLFIFLFIFFTKIHRLVIFDADDWTYVAEPRSFIPIIGIWNPAKVFPESLMPLFGSISAFIVNPIINDYVKSFTIVTAALVSLFIVIYLLTFNRMINNKFNLGKVKSLIITLIFMLMHFALFYVGKENNQFLFWCHNVNCYYNYLIPNLLGFSIVFTLMGNKNNNYSLKRDYSIKSGFVAILFYLAIFSNLYCNIIVAVYAGATLLLNIIKDIYNKTSIKKIIENNLLLIIILILWLLSVFFELTGERAAYPYGGSFITNVIAGFKNLGYVILHMINRPIIIFILIIMITFIIKLIKNKETNPLKQLINPIICTIVIGIYYILISAKVSPEYMLKTETIFGLYAYGLLFVSLVLGYLLKKSKFFNIFICFVLCFLIIETNCSILTYKESNSINIAPEICYQVDNYIMDQIKKANSQGKTIMDLYVPKYSTKDNWPQANYFGKRISNTLYRHKIIDRKIQINVVPSDEVNKKFGIENN